MPRDRRAAFSWAVNPSTRPDRRRADGRDPQGPKQANIPLANPPGSPPRTPRPSRRAARGIPFIVKGPPGPTTADDGPRPVGDPDTDWDLYITATGDW